MQRKLMTTTIVLAATASLVAEPPAENQLLEQMQQLQTQVQELKSEVGRLRTQTNEDWMNSRRVEEIKTLVRQVLADADTRASLVEGASAGHDGNKLFLASEDGSFLMNIEGQIQARHIANFRRDTASDPVDDGETGFQLRRTKLKFSGHIADPRLKYVVQIAIERNSQNLFGDVITIGYDLTDDLYIWIGDDKAPFLREELTSSKRQLAVERSLLNEVFTLDIVQGIGAKWNATEIIKVQAMFNDGARSGDSGGDDRVLEDIEPEPGSPGFTDDAGAGKDFNGDAVDYAVTGRIDYLLAGSWKQYKDFTSFPGEDLFATFGAAIHYEVDETGDATPNDALLLWTVDGSMEYNGLNFYTAFVMAHTDFEEVTGGPSRNNFTPWGVLVQGGYNIPLSRGSIEPFARYEHIDLDGVDVTTASAPAESSFDLVTFGLNWYHHKHAAKFTADVVYALDPLIGGTGGLKGLSDSLGLLTDSEGHDDQTVVRLQYQLLF